MPGVCSPAGGEAALAERSGRAAADTEPARTARRVTCCIGFSGSLLLSACLVFFVLRSFTPLTPLMRTSSSRDMHHEASSAIYAYHSCGGRPKQLGVIAKFYAFGVECGLHAADRAMCQSKYALHHLTDKSACRRTFFIQLVTSPYPSRDHELSQEFSRHAGCHIAGEGSATLW